MRICLPSQDDGGLDAPVAQHFGRAPYFTVYDQETGKATVVENDSHHHGGEGSPPKIVAGTDADALVCGNLGGNAAEKFDALGIDVFTGADGTVRAALEQLDDGGLTEVGPDGTDCGHGHDHDCGHDHGHGHDHSEDHGHSHGGHGRGEGPGHDHSPDHDHGN